jgi:hypothetical protein
MTLKPEILKQIEKNKPVLKDLNAYFKYMDVRSLKIKIQMNSPRLTEIGSLEIIARHLNIENPYDLLDMQTRPVAKVA